MVKILLVFTDLGCSWGKRQRQRQRQTQRQTETDTDTMMKILLVFTDLRRSWINWWKALQQKRNRIGGVKGKRRKEKKRKQEGGREVDPREDTQVCVCVCVCVRARTCAWRREIRTWRGRVARRTSAGSVERASWQGRKI